MQKRKTKRSLKQRLRLEEAKLSKQISAFINEFDYDLSLPFDELLNFENESLHKNFFRLNDLRWRIAYFILYRHQLNKEWFEKWGESGYFFELLDTDSIEIDKEMMTVEIRGGTVCWAMGEVNYGKWWNDDQQPHRSGSYRGKVRGEVRMLDNFCWMETEKAKNKIEEWRGGYFVIEPVRAIFTLSKSPKRNSKYEIEFGKGSSFTKIKG